MIRVRFPNGQCVTYNEANHVERLAEFTDLYESKAKRQWIAQVPNTAIIECVEPCSVTNPISGMTLEKAIQFVLDNGRSCGGSWTAEAGLLSDLKLMLQDFNRQRRTWK